MSIVTVVFVLQNLKITLFEINITHEITIYVSFLSNKCFNSVNCFNHKTLENRQIL